MDRRELAAAGITDPQLARSYELCRRLVASHGRTYYLASLLLPPAKRPFIHALYGFARCADEIVDNPTVPDPAARLHEWRADFFAELRTGRSRHPVRAAVLDTALRWEIDPRLFEAFLDSMAMDLAVDHYESFADLSRYIYGSAVVIGLQLLPILEAAHPAAERYAEELGTAFQLANFIRDVGEDLNRGRIYLPLEELARFDVHRPDLAGRVTTPQLRAALQFQVARVRRLERASRPGTAMLHPAVRDCIDTARNLYCGIVDEVEANDYDVFTRRAAIGGPRRAAVAGAAAARAITARRRFGVGRIPPTRGA